MELKDKIQDLVAARTLLKDIEDRYEMEIAPLKEAKKKMEAEIIQIFKDRGEFSTRIDKATASLSVRKTAQIFDEQELVNSLKEKNLNGYVEERVSDLFKDSVLKEQAKLDIMEVLPGVIIKETEYLSIRSNDKADARKQTTNEFTQTPKE